MPFWSKKKASKASSSGSSTMASLSESAAMAGSTASLKASKASKGGSEWTPPSDEAIKRQMIRSKEGKFAPKLPILRRDYKQPANLDDLNKMVSQPWRMTRYHPKNKPVHYKVSVDFETFELLLAPESSGKQTLSIEMFHVQELRTGEYAANAKDFKASGAITDKTDVGCCLVVMHGTEFRLKQLCLLAPSTSTAQAFADVLWAYSRHVAPECYSSFERKRRWLRRQWRELAGSRGAESLTLREVKNWMPKINFKPSNKETREYFDQVAVMEQNVIGEQQFYDLYYNITADDNVTDRFKRFSSTGSKTSLTANDLLRFSQEEQGGDLSMEDCKRIVQRWGDGKAITMKKFLHYLHSDQNHLWSPAEDLVYQDMSYPLACYFIASSHNTYLMGDQLRSESSTEAYVRALLDGCRCVEIDCWGGTGSDVIVYHGHTLTSKIKFHDVIVAVQRYAFTASEYPLILSIENHTNIAQQKYMADQFKEVFGSQLIISPHPNANEAGRDCYPSPEQLKGRVIIKHKKLQGGSDSIDTSAKMEDLSSARRNGILFLEDPINNEWYKHYFALTDHKLFYAELEEVEEDEYDDVDADERPKTETELHFSEPWFHGRLVGDRGSAEAALKDFRDIEGTFLVRESGSYAGEYTLSFVYNRQPQHCRIRKQSDQFFLTDQISFGSLYEMIEYYRRVPLKSKDFTLRLTNAVPQPAPHENEPWFHKHKHRSEAEDMLKCLDFDGAYLIRSSDYEPNSFAISFRAEGKIKHCRIRKEGRMYCIGDAEFDTLNNLVDYYSRKPLFRRMKLRYPVDEQLLKDKGKPPEDDIYRSDELYQDPNPLGQAMANGGPSTNISVKALYPYEAMQKDELSFPAGAVITNVVKKDQKWWQGDYGHSVSGWFPVNYVEEIDHQRIAQEERDDFDNMLGNLEKASLNLQDVDVTPAAARGGQPHVFRVINLANRGASFDVGAESAEDMREWMAAIKEAKKDAMERKSGQTKTRGKKVKINQELSDLIFYSTSVRFVSFVESQRASYQLMSSFNEKKALGLVRANGGQPMEFVCYNIRQLSRVYPQGKRVDSSNFGPQQMWNCGMQLVALNYQTGDRPMWLNHGFFQRNGRCGYVLKPPVMLKPGFNPFEYHSFNVTPIKVFVTVISALHLPKESRGTTSPLVEVEVVGVETDNSRSKTETVSDNGLRPFFDHTSKYELGMQDLASLRFLVQDEDMFGDANVIAQNCYPLGSHDRRTLRPGYRSIQLKNVSNEPFELASLLVHVRVEYVKEDDEEYMSMAEIRKKMCLQTEEHDDLIKRKLAQQVGACQTILILTCCDLSTSMTIPMLVCMIRSHACMHLMYRRRFALPEIAAVLVKSRACALSSLLLCCLTAKRPSLGSAEREPFEAA
eukprot:TRINITY_DN10872_c0_g1_i3.p1 TRINITY_DN10872_c0_g1~~TRINITY_DN10872_c0_g1_i3.p1  ORF type:complete len:1382 (+),score=416.91 TRINITY_DN10872_c0_g1_i3:102-4247(+)